MRITNLLKNESILLNQTLGSKEEAIDALIALHEKSGNLKDREEYKKCILAREAQGSTAVGEGVAIPHAKTDAVKRPALSAITVKNGVDYKALDGKPSNLLFMIAAPMDGDLHLEVLSRLMTLIMDEDFRNRLLSAETAEEFLDIIDKKETEKYPDEAVKEADKEAKTYKILAVTACPTGIAHTYMAAEALQKAGQEMGVPIKVETNGSGGAKNILTAEEIKNADGIIIAADKEVETSRFDGKKVLSVKVSDGIKKPKELIEKVLGGDVPVFHGNKSSNADLGNSSDSFGRRIYKQLMNGVSNMLPFVVAGGIFIALAFLIDTVVGAPQDSNFGTQTPISAFFKTIGNYAFNFMIPVLAGFIGKAIADRPGFLVGIVGGFLATTGSTFTHITGDIPSGFLGALFAGFVGGYLMLGLEDRKSVV